jgi:hypothetical protein
MTELEALREKVRVLENQLALTQGVSDSIVTWLVDYELMKSILAANAKETDFCLFCQHHPSRSHHKDCLIGKLDS